MKGHTVLTVTVLTVVVALPLWGFMLGYRAGFNAGASEASVTFAKGWSGTVGTLSECVRDLAILVTRSEALAKDCGRIAGDRLAETGCRPDEDLCTCWARSAKKNKDAVCRASGLLDSCELCP